MTQPITSADRAIGDIEKLLNEYRPRHGVSVVVRVNEALKTLEWQEEEITRLKVVIRTLRSALSDVSSLALDAREDTEE